MRAFKEMLINNLVCSLFLTGKDAVAYLLQMCFGSGTIVIMWRTAPKRLFVELNLLCVRSGRCAAGEGAAVAGGLLPDGV